MLVLGLGSSLPPLSFFWCPAAEESPCESRVCQNGGRCEAVNGTAACLCQPGYTGADCQTGGWQEQAPGGDGDSSRLGRLPSHPASSPAVVLGGEGLVLLAALIFIFFFSGCRLPPPKHHPGWEAAGEPAAWQCPRLA